jgi:mono/diheme cytochrome c family protein
MRFPRIWSLRKNAGYPAQQPPAGRQPVANVQFSSCSGNPVIKVVLIAVLALVAVLPAVQGQSGRTASSNQKSTPKDDSRVARGKYIVEGVARCEQCHTPRDIAGGPDRSHTLEGAPVWLKSAEPAEDWPTQAPRLAGNPPGTDAEMVTLLTTGVWKNGRHLREPMPQFRMTTEDAEAVVAYLKSLNPAAK